MEFLEFKKLVAQAAQQAGIGDFSLQSSGFLVEKGKKTAAVRSFTVSGNFFELLKSITALSDKAVLPRPGLPSVASPAVLVKELTISGK